MTAETDSGPSWFPDSTVPLQTAEPPPARPRGRRRRRILLVVGGVAVVVGGLYAADVATGWGDVPRNTEVAGVAVGGLSPSEAAAALTAAAPSATEPVTVRYRGRGYPIVPSEVGLAVDAQATVAAVDGTVWNPVRRITSFWETTVVEPVVTAEPALEERLVAIAAEAGTTRQDATVRFDGTIPVPVYPVDGEAVDVAAGVATVEQAWLDGQPGDLVAVRDPARGTKAQVDATVTAVAVPAVAAPVLVVAGERRAEVTPAQIAAGLRFTASTDPAAATLAPSFDPPALQAAAPEVFARFDSAPFDARFQVVGETPVLLPSAAGTQLPPTDLGNALAGVLTAPAPRQVTVALAQRPPAFTTAQAAALGITQQLSTFTTYHPCCQARVQNIHAIADILDGYVVQPGATFDLNAVVGKRDTARGFVEAPMIYKGEFRKSVGGGISQFATTLYNATFFGGLKDVEHSPHSYYISKYPPGREATVSWPDPDLIFENDTPYGVLIDTSYTDTAITVSLYSTKQYDIEAVVGPRTKVTNDPKVRYIDRDDDCQAASASPGFTITNTRIFRQNGAEVKRDSFTWTYRPQPKMVCGPPPS